MTKAVSDKQARKTIAVVSVVLSLLGAWNFYKGRTTVAGVLAIIGLVLVAIGLSIPAVARGFHRLWMGVALVLGYVNSRVILFLLYFGIVTPYGFISRLINRDPLNRRGKVVKAIGFRVKVRDSRESNSNDSFECQKPRFFSCNPE